MISITDQHFSINRTLLSAVGLWPYQKSIFVRLQVFCFSIIMTSCLIFQFTTFCTTKCSADVIIKVFSLASANIAFTVKYNSFYLNGKTIKYLLGQLQRIQDDLKDNNEIAIIKRHGNIAKRFTVGILIIAGGGGVIISMVYVLSNFLSNDISSINKSESQSTLILMEYFVDQEKYSHLMIIHMAMSFYIGITSLLATGTMFITYLQYICGMFSIASYRVEHAIKICSFQDRLRSEIVARKGISRAVDIHRKAMTYSMHLISSFDMMFMCLIACSVLILSTNIFRIFQGIASKCNIEDFLLFVIITFISLIYMFFANLMGQDIIDHYEYIFITGYNVQWYVTPVRVQKLLLFLLQRSQRAFGLKSMGGFFTASLPCFATLINASISYFTVMYSMRP